MSRRGKLMGRWGEEQAAKFLTRNGFKIIRRNYYTTVGEIDIVAQKDDDYYFIEVKTRPVSFLNNDDAFTYKQRQHLQKAVAVYCYRQNITQHGLILAGLIVAVDRAARRVKFYFTVFYDL